jgi:hypothetical protein
VFPQVLVSVIEPAVQVTLEQVDATDPEPAVAPVAEVANEEDGA